MRNYLLYPLLCLATLSQTGCWWCHCHHHCCYQDALREQPVASPNIPAPLAVHPEK